MPQEIIDGILNVHRFNTSGIFLDPNGKNPVCIPGVGTGICERCNNNIRVTKGSACPGVPRDERWSYQRVNNIN